jgi:hypothetical protein
VNLAGIGGIINVPVRGQAALAANGSSLLKILGGTIGGYAFVRVAWEKDVHVNQCDKGSRLISTTTGIFHLTQFS